MKRISTLTLLAALALVLSVTGAFGEVKDFGRFTIDVPEGWTATQTGDTGIVTRNDNMAQFTMTITDTGGKSLSELVEAEVNSYKEYNFTDITTPEKDSKGSYKFSARCP